MKRINLFIIILSFACFASGQGIKSVEKINGSSNKIGERFLIYSLPQTNLAIKITTIRNITFCGPYAAYANELLGLKNIPLENKVDWMVDSINIQPYVEPNPEGYYAAYVEKGFNPKPLFDLSEAGLILNPSFQNDKYSLKNNIVKPEAKSDGFNNLSVQKFYSESADTFYKTILKDSIYVRIPIIKSKSELKTLREKAKEAADVIIKIRQRRFDMIISDDEALPEANSFKLDLAEMKKIEDEYLELFTGKKTLQKFSSQFNYTPNNNDSLVVLCNFSATSGICKNAEKQSFPLILKIDKQNKTIAVKNWLKNQVIAGKDQLLYSLPDAANISVSINSNILVSQKALVYQFVVIIPYPVDGKY